MMVVARIKRDDDGYFVTDCKTLPGVLEIKGRHHGGTIEELGAAIKEEFIEQFYGGEDPGDLELDIVAMSTTITFDLDRPDPPANHSLFEYGGAGEEEEADQEALPGGPLELPAGELTEGWARETNHEDVWHFYRDGLPLCNNANSQTGEIQEDLPVDGACCYECMEALKIEWEQDAMTRAAGEQASQEEDPSPEETPEEKEARMRRTIIGWGRKKEGQKLHALDEHGLAICYRVQDPLEVETDHPEDPADACRFCKALLGEEDEEA